MPRRIAALLVATVLLLAAASVAWFTLRDPGAGAATAREQREADAATVALRSRTAAPAERSAVAAAIVPSDAGAGDEPDPARDPAMERALGGYRGRVVDERGQPLAGATVEARMVTVDPEKPWHRRVTTTGHDGRFELRGLLPGRAWLLQFGDATHVGRRNGLLDRNVFPLPVPGRLLDLEDLVAQRAGEVRGTVLAADGSPCGGAEVTLAAVDRHSGHRMQFSDAGDFAHGDVQLRPGRTGWIAFEPPRRVPLMIEVGVTTGADGSFVARGLVPRRYVVSVQQRGRALPVQTFVDVAAGETVDVGTMRLRAGGEVRGRVLTHQGEPAANARVLVGVALPQQEGTAGVATAPTAEDGTFAIGGHPGPFAIVAARGAAHTPWTVCARAPLDAPLELRLPPVQDVDVRVLASDGGVAADEVVQQAAVVVVPADAATADALGCDRGTIGNGGRLAVPIERLAPGTATLRLRGLGEGNYLLRVTTAAGESHVELRVPGPPAVDVTLAAPERLVVHVVNGTGAPIANVRVEAPPHVAFTDVAGIARLVPGADHVFAYHPAHGDTTVFFEDGTRDVRVVLRRPARLFGQVQGSPNVRDFTGWQASAWPTEPYAPIDWPIAPSGAFDVTLLPGEYEITLYPPDGVNAKGCPVEQVALDEGEERRLNLEVEVEPVVVHGHVRGEAYVDGAPASACVVRWSDRGERETTVAPNGSFDCGAVHAAAVALCVDLPASRGGVRLHIEEVQVPLRGPLRIDVRTAALAGRVVDATGAGVSGVRVRLERRRFAEWATTATITEPDGTFRFAQLPRTKWTLSASAWGQRAAVRTVDLSDGDVSGLRLTLARPVAVRGHVQAAAAPVPLTNVSVKLRGNERLRANCEASGEVSIDDVLPGTYEVWICIHCEGRSLAIRWHDAFVVAPAEAAATEREPPALEVQFTARELALLDEAARAEGHADLQARLAATRRPVADHPGRRERKR